MKKYQKGSITVEAAFIMPIVIFTLFALIYLSFCLHDRCRIQGTIDKILHKAGITMKHDADIVSGAIDYKDIGDRGVFYNIFGCTQEDNIKIENYLKRELLKGLFLTKNITAKVEADKFKVTITVKAITNVKIPFFHELFKPFSYIEVTENYPLHNPTEAIRAAEVIMETGSSIKGVKVFKEKLESLFGKK